MYGMLPWLTDINTFGLIRLAPGGKSRISNPWMLALSMISVVAIQIRATGDDFPSKIVPCFLNGSAQGFTLNRRRIRP